MNDKDLEAFEEWLRLEFGEPIDNNRAYLYEKSIFRFACEYKDKESARQALKDQQQDTEGEHV